MSKSKGQRKSRSLKKSEGKKLEVPKTSLPLAQSETQTKQPRGPVRHLVVSWKVIWWVVGALASILGLVSVISFFPRVNVTIGETLDPTNPLETRFIFQNNGVFPVYDVKYWSMWFDGTYLVEGTNWNAQWFACIISDSVNKVAPDGQFSMRLGYRGPPHPVPQRKAIMQICVDYTPAFHWKQKSKVVQFSMRRDTEGNPHWFPFDTGYEWTATNHPILME